MLPSFCCDVGGNKEFCDNKLGLLLPFGGKLCDCVLLSELIVFVSFGGFDPPAILGSTGAKGLPRALRSPPPRPLRVLGVKILQ